MISEEKIYHLSRDEIIIRVRKKDTKEKIQIFIRNGELISLTQKQFETPVKQTSFAMALRKYLLNGRIIETGFFRKIYCPSQAT